MATQEGRLEMTVSCNNGTHRPVYDVTKAVCLHNRWNPLIPKCKPLSCTVPELQHGSYTSSGEVKPPGSMLDHTKTIYARCDKGYRSEGFYFSNCKYGQFEGIGNISCVENSCREPKSKINGTSFVVTNAVHRDWSHGIKILIQCQRGYGPKGSANATCLLGKWSPAELECIPKSCDVPLLPNGYFLFQNRHDIKDKPVKHSIFIEAFCRTGYSLHGKNLIGCYHGQWIPDIPRCNKLSCPAPTSHSTSPLILIPSGSSDYVHTGPSYGNTSLNTIFYYHGSVVKLNCDRTRYKPKHDETSAICQDGKWTVKKLECEPIPCTPMANSTNSPISIVSSVSGVTGHATVVRLHCDTKKFRPLYENIRSVCLFGKWTPTYLECEPKHCILPEFKETNYTFLDNQPVMDFTIPSGTYINVACNKPHLVPTVVLCHYSKWVPEVRSCYDSSCYINHIDKLDYWTGIESGKISTRRYADNGTSIKVSCKYGYQLSNDSGDSSFCLQGKWYPQEPFCEDVYCHIPEQLVPFSENTVLKVKNGFKLTIECPPDSFPQSLIATCMNGTWAPPIQSCSPKKPRIQKSGSPCKCPLQGDNVVFHWDIDLENDSCTLIPNGVGLHAHCIDVGEFRLMGSVRLLCEYGVWQGKLPVCQRTEEDELAPPRIYIDVITAWDGKEAEYSVTVNGSIEVKHDTHIQLSCTHFLYESESLEWLPPNHTILQPSNIPEDIGHNTTGIRLQILTPTPDYSGRYTCRIKDTAIFHFVDILIL